MKKRHLILLLLIVMTFIPSVKAGYNGASGQLEIPKSTSGCDPSWNGYCLWNANNSKGLQITLYYFGENGARTQIGRQIHVISNNQYFYDTLAEAGYNADQINNWLANVVVDGGLEKGILTDQMTWYFKADEIEKYLMDETNFRRYVETYIGVQINDLTLTSEGPGYNAIGYRLVVEPMYSSVLKGTFYLKTVKELAAHGITNEKRYPSISAALYLEHDDVGITRGNGNGTSNRQDIAKLNTGWGYNIIDITNKLPQKCEWTTESSCCDEKNNLTGTELENFKFAHPACFDTNPAYKEPTTCDFDLNMSVLNMCTSYSSGGYIKDIDNWGCIYKSATADNEKVKGYFLKYGSSTSSCAVYCRDEVEYEYPKQGMIALAGNRFIIGNFLNSYTFRMVNGQNKVIPASLGPVKVTIKRECSITGTVNAECNNALQEQLDSLKTNKPTMTFTYNPDYYGEVTETLEGVFVEDDENDETIAANGDVKEIKRKTVTYEYKLPNSTFKYVSKNIGKSFKNASEAGVYPVINIGPHLPIHFSQDNNTINFELNISKFNLRNFDDLVINGDKMPAQYNSSIESYIKTLIDSGNATPSEIGGIYYLDNNFVNLLSANGYSVANFLYMPCANTNTYTCHNNANGIFCYDEGTTSNSTSTYALFNACIGNVIKSGTKSYKQNLKYACSFEVDKCINKNDCEPQNGLDVIFRTISLNDPFPSIDGDGRNTGTNWCYGTDCSNTNSIVENVILNNRDVDSDKIYTDLDPLYKIELTPELIKKIRKYNKSTDYTDFNLECNSDGNNCKSTFIREKINADFDFSDAFSGCGIDNKDAGLDCASDDAW